MEAAFATEFANRWISAWNTRDLPQILALYHDDFSMASPYIAALGFAPSGKLTGKQAVAAYWQKALTMLPDLHFELQQVLVGAQSLVLYYQGHRGNAAELFYFDTQGLVIEAAAHYGLADT